MISEQGGHETSTTPVGLPEIAPAKDRSLRPLVMNGFDGVRANIREYSTGIFQPPPPYGQPEVQKLCNDSNTPLPPKAHADLLLQKYRATLHHLAPLLHWPTFHSEVEQLYQRGTFQGLRQIWKALFFAVLACGSIMKDPAASAAHGDAEAIRFSDIAKSNTKTVDDEVSVDHIKVCNLLSVCYMDMNRKTASWFWLSSAVRFAQFAGLHRDRVHHRDLDGEMQKRVWWSIYNWDR